MKTKINDGIDIRYEEDVIKAFDKFIEKWCGNYKGHLLDNDGNDGEYMREKIREIMKQVDKPDYYGEVMSQVEEDKNKLEKECVKCKGTGCWNCTGTGINPTTPQSTHSPLEIEKIKEIFLPYSDAEITINKLIRNQKKLYQFIKEKL